MIFNFDEYCKYVFSNTSLKYLFYYLIAEMLWVQTSKQYGYRFAWKTALYKSKFFTFELMACGEGYVSLAQTPGISNHDAYEILIGGWYNSFVIIRR